MPWPAGRTVRSANTLFSSQGGFVALQPAVIDGIWLKPYVATASLPVLRNRSISSRSRCFLASNQGLCDNRSSHLREGKGCSIASSITCHTSVSAAYP